MIKTFQIDVNNRHHVHEFLNLPFIIYQKIPQWVPMLANEAKKMLDQRQHPFYRHSEAAFFLCTNNKGEVSGRVAVLNNKNYNIFNNSKTAFFYLFDCINDFQVANSLFSQAIEWVKSRHFNEIVGPKGFSVLDGFGLLVKGFEHRPALGIPYNPAYYVSLIEQAGFEAINESVSGYLERESFHLPEKIHQVAELVIQRRGLQVITLNSRQDLRSVIPKLKDLYNSALGGTTGSVPLTNEEVDSMAKQMLWFADPRLIKVILKDEELVGFLFAYPDISAALQLTKGRLFPFGWLYLLLELRNTKWININGAGIVGKYRGLGGTAVLFEALHKSVYNSRYDYADLVQVGVENDRMQRELLDLGVTFYKPHRMYRLAL